MHHSEQKFAYFCPDCGIWDGHIVGFVSLVYRLPTKPLWWRHNECDGVSNHRRLECLFSRLFRRRPKKTSKFRVTGLYEGNSPRPVNSPHKGPVTRKMFPFHDVIMICFMQGVEDCSYQWSHVTPGHQMLGGLPQGTKQTSSITTAPEPGREVTTHHYWVRGTENRELSWSLQWRHNERDGVSNHQP